MSIFKVLFRAIFGRLPKAFTVVFALLCLCSVSKSRQACQGLFPTVKTIQIHPRLLTPIPPQSWALAWLTNDLFVQGQNGHVDGKKSADKLRPIVENTPAEILKQRASELWRALESAPRDPHLDSKTYTRMWALYLALDPDQANTQLARLITTRDSKMQMLYSIGEFLKAFNPQQAKVLAVLLLRDFTNARKTPGWFTAERTFGHDEILFPKKSISFILKILMGYPELVKSEISPNKAIRFGTFDKYIRSLKTLLDAAQVEFQPPNAKQIGTVIKIFQTFLKEWSAKNPNESASIILRGSFANGLAVGRDIDVDIVIVHSELFQEFWNHNRKRLQNEIDISIQGLGPKLPSVFIDPGDPDSKSRANLTNQMARESGFLNTISFEIFPDRVDILIHDHKIGQIDHQMFEIFGTE